MTARLAVIALATILAFGGIGAAVAELFDDDNHAAASHPPRADRTPAAATPDLQAAT